MKAGGRNGSWALVLGVAGGCALAASLGCGTWLGPGGPKTDAGIPDGGDPTGPALVGEVRDESGQLLPNLQVLACQLTICLYGASGDDGRFVIPVEPPADIALKTIENVGFNPPRGAALQPIRFSSDGPVNVGTLWVPLLSQGAPLGPITRDPQTLAVGDGLELTVRRADLTAPVGVSLSHIRARAVPLSQVAPYQQLEGREAIAVFALSPFGAKSRSPISVRVPSNLPAGTPVTFQTISELNGFFSAAVPGTADGTFVTTDPAHGIEELTRLVISR